ncbi:MAG: polymerase [Chlorobi bacterium]|nr:polymerase [Chlorobiota bacterium]
MTARDVAKVLYDIETYLGLHGENDFKSSAYGRAARAMETSGIDIAAAMESPGGFAIPGVGKALASEIREIVESGTSSQLEELRGATPPGLIDILKIRGLGAKKVRAIHLQLGVDTLRGLEEAVRENRVASLPGFGAKSQAKILEGIEELKKSSGKFRINTATEYGEHLLSELERLSSTVRVAIAGRLRRGAEEFDSLSFVVESDDPAAVERDLAGIEILGEIARDGRTIRGLIDGSYSLRIDVTPAAHYHAVLHQRTGASDYAFMISIPLADRGYDLREDGLFRDGEPVALESEDDLFRLAGAAVIPPELREGIDEVRRALDGDMPRLLEPDDIQGMLHVHSTWSDGRSGIAEIVEHVRGLGYRYLLITDHSKSAFYANGLDERRLEAQGREIDAINEGLDPAEFRVLKGIECDILGDGTLDFSDDVLATLDAVVASVHSQFTLSGEAQTERICRALANPYVTILGHSTGRLILKRKGYDVDLKHVIQAAAEHGKSIELNCNPYRLDLNWRMARYALRKGVPIAINPDAHTLADFANMRYGVMMGRKAWLTRERTLNALSLDGFLEFVRKSRGEKIVEGA